MRACVSVCLHVVVQLNPLQCQVRDSGNLTYACLFATLPARHSAYAGNSHCAAALIGAPLTVCCVQLCLERWRYSVSLDSIKMRAAVDIEEMGALLRATSSQFMRLQVVRAAM